jgi:ATP-binding cassette subfamily B protein
VFEDVWFRYIPTQDWVLRGVSFTAEPGQTVALVGHTGAGKTTVLSLLLRWYDVERGRITVDGVDVRELSFADLRGAIGFVPQDVFLFAGDATANVALERGLPPEAAGAALARVGAAHLAARRLGERGLRVSVGERQLLAFARALAGEPRILVLDEATSSVDAEAEARIQTALAELMAGRTSVVVAHRLSTVQHADQILVMHHGRVVERGDHQSLLGRGGLYETLYQLQLGAQSAAAA